MKRKFYFLLCLTMIFTGGTGLLKAQPTIENAFFDKVDYIGAFGSVDWTSGWSNWTPQTTVYPATTDVIAAGDITTNTTLSAGKVYLLDGWVYIKSGAILTIEPGTIIRGSKANKGALIVEKGARIMAEGTVDNPIVFTSNQDAGSRSYGDWGGLIVLGNAVVNKTDPVIEGGPTSTYGGSDDADNSGILKYVRIEFPGIAFQPDKEINGLTMGGVGNGTTIDYVQVSFCGDDSYEWFGGTVNARHLIAFRGWDDDFDTDYGYRGMVQYAVSLRDPNIADAGSGSNSFESDNDGSGSEATPITQAMFSNVSSFGPLVTLATTVNANYKRAMHLRRNTKLSIYNSLFAGYLTGLLIDGATTQGNATVDSLIVRNTIMAGCKDYYGADFDSTYFINILKENMILASNDDLGITDPFNLDAPDFLPESNSLVLTASNWYDGSISTVDVENAAEVPLVNLFPNPFSGSSKIGITLTDPSTVRIKLYDIAGNLIAILADESRVTGYHEILLNILQKGIYFTDIMINDTRQVIKLVAR